MRRPPKTCIAKCRRAPNRTLCRRRCYPGCRYVGASPSGAGRAHVWICPKRPGVKVERAR